MLTLFDPCFSALSSKSGNAKWVEHVSAIHGIKVVQKWCNCSAPAEVGKKLKRPVSAVTIRSLPERPPDQAETMGPLMQDPYKIRRDEVKRLLAEGSRPIGKPSIANL